MKNPIPHLLTTRRLNQLRRLGLINETRLRNIRIKNQFVARQQRGKRVWEIAMELSERENLSPEQIIFIRYRRDVKALLK